MTDPYHFSEEAQRTIDWAIATEWHIREAVQAKYPGIASSARAAITTRAVILFAAHSQALSVQDALRPIAENTAPQR